MNLGRIASWIGWLLALVVFPLIYIFGPGEYRGLLERIQTNVPFGFVRIENGWLNALLGLGVVLALILLYSYIVISLNNSRTSRAKSFWPLFWQGVTHLTMWAFIVFAYYPILQILAASFDPTNSLYRFSPPQSDNLLIRARVIPDFSQANFANYRALVDGVVIYSWQWLLLAGSLITLATTLGIAGYRRLKGDDKENSPLARYQSWALIVFAVATFILVLFLGPNQFTSQNTEAKFVLWIRNTLLVSGITGILTVVLTATAGYAFARFTFPGRYSMLLVFIFIQMFPGFLGLVAIYFLISSLGLLNTFTGLVLAYSGGVISFGTWIYKGFLENIPKSLEEAAMIDGASKWQVFYQILLPLSAPIFVFIFLMQFVGTYSDFILANLFLTGTDTWTVGMGLRSFTTGQFNTKWGLFAASAVLGSIPILLTFYGFQRYFVSGYTAGGVKE